MTSAAEYRRKLEERNVKATVQGLGDLEFKYVSFGDAAKLLDLATKLSPREFAVALLANQIRTPGIASDQLALLEDRDLLALIRETVKSNAYLWLNLADDADFEQFQRVFISRQEEIARNTQRQLAEIIVAAQAVLRDAERSLKPLIIQTAATEVKYLEVIKRLVVQQLTWSEGFSQIRHSLSKIALAAPRSPLDLGVVSYSLALRRLSEVVLPFSQVVQCAVEIADAYAGYQRQILRIFEGRPITRGVTAADLEALSVGGYATAKYADITVALEARRPLDAKVQPPSLLDELDSLLNEIDPRLASLRSDAREAVTSALQNPIRAASHLARELVTEVLHRLAPDHAIRTSPIFTKYDQGDGKITRRMRIAYIAGENEQFVFETKLDEGILEVNDALIAKAHTFSADDQRSIAKALISQIEAFLYSLLVLRRPPTT